MALNDQTFSLNELPIAPVGAQPQTFQPSLLDPTSMILYNSLGRKHMSSDSLLSTTRLAGDQLNMTINQQFVSLKGTMSYSELLQGLLYQGEKLGQYGTFKALQFSYLTISDENNVTMTTRPSGVCMLTDKRLLFLSSQASHSSSMQEVGDAKKLPGGYSLNASLGDSTFYLPIPLRLFRSVEMNGKSGVSGEVMISGKEPACGGFCGICGMLKEWSAGPVTISQLNEMCVNIGLLLPPWERRGYLHIFVTPDTPNSVVRDFVALLQQHAHGLH
ncbi:predicted protein [Nematostella vectensis]|uniref:Uncharacterized protein n=1 Tax=Nematostella vectensis TaxID=45351 RepID=A7RY46_NEMVE|nr:uncharacterized protein LOC5515568 [Nematostella vectensis]EDO43575.1 predicted protein [Nematostella vectensis]|eukprot:XP_001635638.1 predicted protein [Nematostella vectensis]